MTFPTGVDFRKCSDEELTTMLAEAGEASKHARKRGRVMGIVAAHRLKQMKELLMYEERAGAVTRAIAEIGTVTRMETWTGTRTTSGRAKHRRRSARNCTRVVDAIRHVYSACVTISADRGDARGHSIAPLTRSAACTCTSHREDNRVRGTRRSERGRGWDQSRGAETETRTEPGAGTRT